MISMWNEYILPISRFFKK